MDTQKSLDTGTNKQEGPGRASASYMAKEQAKRLRRQAADNLKRADLLDQLAEIPFTQPGNPFEDLLWTLLCGYDYRSDTY